MYNNPPLPYHQERKEEYSYKGPQSTYHASGLVDGFLVPGLLALLVGLACGALVLGLLGLVAGWVAIPFKPGYAALVAGSGAFIWAVLYFARAAIFRLERLAGVDLNGDGAVGLPELPSLDKLEITVTENNGATNHFFTLPGTKEQFTEFARGVLGGTSLAEDNWVGVGRLYRGPDYAALRAELMKRGYIQWINGAKNQGAELTPQGQRVFRAMAGTPPTPGQQ